MDDRMLIAASFFAGIAVAFLGVALWEAVQSLLARRAAVEPQRTINASRN